MASVSDLIVAAAQSAGVPVDLAIEIATQESGLNQNATGPTPPSRGGPEVGVFQLLPSSFPGVNIWDLQTNITTGVGYIALMLSTFGDPVAAVAAYNAGPTVVHNAIQQYGLGNCPGGYPAWLEGIPASTQSYVRSIFSGLSNYTVCVAGVGIPISSGSPSGSPPPVSSAGVPSSGPSVGVLLLAGVGLVLLWWML
jgi:soluble lytic murein transglycosylase-like protein